MKTSTNGTKSTQDLQQFELVKSETELTTKTKKPRETNDLKLLSLSTNKQGEITKILNGIETFNYCGRDFTIEFKNLNHEYIYCEGYGAALTAITQLSEGVDSLSILDLGGGTLTLY